MGGLRAEGLGRLGYRSVTHPEARPPARRDMSALRAAMPFSSDRAVLAPCCDFRTIRLRQIAEDHTIGDVAADTGLPALVLERYPDGKTDCPTDTGLRDWRAGEATCCALTGSARSQKTDRTFMYKLLGTAYADAPASRPS
jgi:hypothetical protein